MNPKQMIASNYLTKTKSSKAAKKNEEKRKKRIFVLKHVFRRVSPKVC
jgi:hypothetical protein